MLFFVIVFLIVIGVAAAAQYAADPHLGKITEQFTGNRGYANAILGNVRASGIDDVANVDTKIRRAHIAPVGENMTQPGRTTAQFLEDVIAKAPVGNLSDFMTNPRYGANMVGRKALDPKDLPEKFMNPAWGDELTGRFISKKDREVDKPALIPSTTLADNINGRNPFSREAAEGLADAAHKAAMATNKEQAGLFGSLENPRKYENLRSLEESRKEDWAKESFFYKKQVPFSTVVHHNIKYEDAFQRDSGDQDADHLIRHNTVFKHQAPHSSGNHPIPVSSELNGINRSMVSGLRGEAVALPHGEHGEHYRQPPMHEHSIRSDATSGGYLRSSGLDVQYPHIEESGAYEKYANRELLDTSGYAGVRRGEYDHEREVREILPTDIGKLPLVENNSRETEWTTYVTDFGALLDGVRNLMGYFNGTAVRDDIVNAAPVVEWNRNILGGTARPNPTDSYIDRPANIAIDSQARAHRRMAFEPKTNIGGMRYRDPIGDRGNALGRDEDGHMNTRKGKPVVHPYHQQSAGVVL